MLVFFLSFLVSFFFFALGYLKLGFFPEPLYLLCPVLEPSPPSIHFAASTSFCHVFHVTPLKFSFPRVAFPHHPNTAQPLTTSPSGYPLFEIIEFIYWFNVHRDKDLVSQVHFFICRAKDSDTVGTQIDLSNE